MDDADRAAMLQDTLNTSALAARKAPTNMRSNVRCAACHCTNDRPEYAICSECLMEGRRATAAPSQSVTCQSCRYVQPVPDTPDAHCRCELGVVKVRTTRGVSMPLVPHIDHHCHSWEPSPHPAVGSEHVSARATGISGS